MSGSCTNRNTGVKGKRLAAGCSPHGGNGNGGVGFGLRPNSIAKRIVQDSVVVRMHAAQHVVQSVNVDIHHARGPPESPQLTQ
jgi:hypothetical protein